MKEYNNKIKIINPVFPQDDLISEAACAIRDGKIIGFPTRNLYGLGADALNPCAVEKIFNIKERPNRKPILVLIRNTDDLQKLVKCIPDYAYTIMSHFWPGKITLVFDGIESLPFNLTAGTGKIGVRIPGNRVAKSLVDAVGKPITGTSANISGFPGCASVKEFDERLIEKLDLILDAGQLNGGKGSTVVDVTVYPPKILREGEVSGAEIFSLLSI